MDRTRSTGLELDMPLDERIAHAVHVLRAAGVETCESCQGGKGHVFPEPTIQFHGGPGEGFRAYGIAIQNGLPVYGIRRLWTVDDNELTGPVWEMVFRNQPRRGVTTACNGRT